MAWLARTRGRLGLRATVLLLAVALLLPVLPPIEASQADDDPFGRACPDGLGAGHRFDDIAGNTHEATIECLVGRGITLGTSPTTYAPANVVRRDQMASFLVRLIEQTGTALPDATVTFTDVGTSVHAAAIGRLATVGIVRGVDEDRYAPNRSVTRAQMATFLVRTAEYLTGSELRSEPVDFIDIDGSVHRDNIEKVATVGIALGTSATTYEPDRAVRRDQMASFLIRSLERLLTPAAGLPELSFEVDASLEPAVPQLRVDEVEGPDADRRSLAAISDEFGIQTDVVADELIVSAPPAELDRFLERWGASVILTVDPTELDASLDPIHLLRVDPALADTSDLAQRLAAGPEPVFGAHRVSEEAVLGLLAMAADGNADGLAMGLNPVLYPSVDYIDGGFADSPTIQGTALTTSYDPDPATWPHFASGTVQDIGVVDAWRALALADRVDPPANQRIGIAILDGGFADVDLPPGSSGANNELGLGQCNGTHCPWHGTSVTQVAAAVPGNDAFTAGSGGPVAAAMMYGVSLSLMDRISISVTAANPLAGPVFPRVLNMSFGGAVGRLVAIPLKPVVDAIMIAIAAGGTLPIASAGNEGQHVNRTECGWFTCYEVAQWLPCQARAVLCVGGLNNSATSRHPNSNWGEDVRLWAPFWHYVGVDPIFSLPYAEPPNEVRVIPGTSFSAPFVSGIAALVAAADRSLSGNQIRDLLLSTAIPSSDAQVTAIVQARTAVEAAFGVQAFDHQIVLPTTGAEVVRGQEFNVRSERTVPDLNVTWRLDGQVATSGTGQFQAVGAAATRELDPGTYELSATVTRGPYTLTRSIGIEVVNEPPTVSIELPTADAEIYVSDPTITFRARVTNRERVLDDSEISWEVARVGGGVDILGSGRELQVAASVLGEGTWTVSAVANDGFDDGRASIEVTVLPDPLIPLPTVSIVQPSDGAFFPFEGLEDGNTFYADVTFVGEATESLADPTPLSGDKLVWTTTYAYLQEGEPVTDVLGTGTSVVGRIRTPGSCSTGTNHDITLTATNTAGQERSTTIRISVRGPVC